MSGGGPLADVRVVELGRYVAAPLAGRLLADWGADVIKVEAPDGDPMRWGPLGDRPDSSPQFASVNRGKRSVTLDLQSPAGCAALCALVDDADVLLHNLRDAALARLGMDVSGLRHTRPGLIVCGISGFGRGGPRAGDRAFDATVAGIAGLYSQLLDAAAPAPAGPAFVDMITGMFAAQAIIAALYARAGNGCGQAVDVTMLAATAAFLDDAFTTYGEAGIELGPTTRQTRMHLFACPTRSGGAFVVQLGSTAGLWQGFAEVLGHPEWITDPRFAGYPARLRNFDELTALVHGAARTRPRAEWLAALHWRDIPAAPINSIADAVGDEQALASGMLVDVDVPGQAPMRMTAPVGSFSGTPIGIPAGPPGPGEHTDEVLARLALDPETRASVDASWRARRTVRVTSPPG